MGPELLPFTEVTAAIAAISVSGIFLLLPLYLSQRRDVLRLRQWMDAEPNFPAQDFALSERRLDRAEQDIARAYADRGEPVPGTAEFEAVKAKEAAAAPPDQKKRTTAGLPALSSEVTADRPALAEVTMERSALEPHPRWRRFVATATQPRWLAVIALAALLIGVAGVIGVDRLLRDEEDPPSAAAPSGIEVAVLNTTAASGIAGRVAMQIEESGFIRGEVGTLERQTDQTLVMYSPGEERSAKRVAKELGGVAVQPIDREAEAAAEDADVVVILGEDQAG